jgi:hypothetical protein
MLQHSEDQRVSLGAWFIRTGYIIDYLGMPMIFINAGMTDSFAV